MARAVFFSIVALIVLFAWRSEVPDVEIRYLPRQTQTGRIFPRHPLGQGFVAEFGGLHAVDVAMVPLGGEPVDLEFVLRADSPNGPELRRVRLAGASLPTEDAWVRFEFEPIDDSSGARFFFELSSEIQSSHSPWTRYRGVPYLVRAWGDRVIGGSSIEGDLLPDRPRLPPDLQHADLRALAFAVDGADLAAAPATLTLSDPASGDVLRTSSARPRAPHAGGWMFFEFDVLPDTRWRALHFALELPPGARLVGTTDGPSIVAFHSTSWASPGVLGATWCGEPLLDRDLVFRAWSTDSRASLFKRLSDRSDRELVYAALASFLSLVAMSKLLRRARSREE